MGVGKHSAFVSTKENEEKKETEEKIKKEKPVKSIDFIKILVIFTICFVIFGSIMAVRIIMKNNEKESKIETEQVVSELPNTLEEIYEGFEVLGKIKIEKLNVEQYILDSTDEEALEKGVIKLYGRKLNNYGNFCIAGHNYEHVFQKLNELEIGDSFIIIDKNLLETEYEIKEIVSVEPDDLSVLLPNEEEIEITLITCENLSTTRLVVKAVKK